MTGRGVGVVSGLLVRALAVVPGLSMVLSSLVVVLDAAIIAQYQRMTHYGITGFGTVAAFAKALKLTDDTSKLKAAVKDMKGADDLVSELAQSAVNAEAAAA